MHLCNTPHVYDTSEIVCFDNSGKTKKRVNRHKWNDVELLIEGHLFHCQTMLCRVVQVTWKVVDFFLQDTCPCRTQVAPCFQAHQPAPPSSSPPGSESLFVTCHVSQLTNLFLPVPPLQSVSPHLWCAIFPSSPTHSSLFLPPGSEFSFAMCHVCKLTSTFLHFPTIQFVSSAYCVTLVTL